MGENVFFYGGTVRLIIEISPFDDIMGDDIMGVIL